MTIDEAIRHCEEVAEEQEELYRICPASESEMSHCNGTKDCRVLKNGKNKGCQKCAAEALDLAIKALEQEPCEDCISRVDALRVAKNEYLRGWHNALCKALSEKYLIHCEEGNFSVIQEETITGLGLSMDCAVGKDVESYMNDLPSVTPARKKEEWIPCSERMPEERGVYIVTEKVYSINDRKHTGCFNLMTEQVEYSNGKWIRASFYEVIAWMPLPEPYKAESEVEKNEN